MIEVEKLLTDLSGRYAAPYERAISDLVVALVRENAPAARDARMALANVTRETMGVAEVLGATALLRAASGYFVALRGDERNMLAFRDPTQLVIPRVTLSEALEDMVTRTPVTLRRAAERTAQRISEIYSEGRVIAFAKAAEASVTREAQRIISETFKAGLGENAAGKALLRAVDAVRKRSAEWTDSYARLAFRNNVNTGVTAGRFRQVQDPDVRAVIPAFRFDAVGDSDTRHNHKAADGVVLRVDNPEWRRIAPPLGHNCRCRVSLLSVPMLQRMGRIGPGGTIHEDRVPHDAGPDEGFRHGGRPDLMMVGS